MALADRPALGSPEFLEYKARQRARRQQRGMGQSSSEEEAYGRMFPPRFGAGAEAVRPVAAPRDVAPPGEGTFGSAVAMGAGVAIGFIGVSLGLRFLEKAFR